MKYAYVLTVSLIADEEIIGAKEQVAMALEQIGQCKVVDVKKVGKIKVEDDK